MPWCEECSKYYAPTALTIEGDCPACGRHVADAPDEPGRDADMDADMEADIAESTPWHFKVLVASLVVYLGWRLAQLVHLA